VTSEVQKRLEEPEAAATTQSTQPEDKVAEVVTKEVAARTGEPRTRTEASKGATTAPTTNSLGATKENPLSVAVVQPRQGPRRASSSSS
jgi:hypothetical protein